MRLKLSLLLVFDMDGVLIDASKSYRVAVQKTFQLFARQEIAAEELSATKKTRRPK